MGFFTSLIFYRVGPPPLIAGPDLARFIERFRALGVLGTPGIFAKVKFGRSIDQDMKPLAEFVPHMEGEHCVLGRHETLPLDIDCAPYASPISELVPRLAADGRAVYRCNIDLGPAQSELCEALRFETPLNAHSFAPDSWGFDIGHIIPASLESEVRVQVSWMAVSLSGNGYCYPRSVREVIDAARRHPHVQRVEALCRETWPSPAKRASIKARWARKKMGELWPYDRTDLPADWFWSIDESG